ncbi:5,10-methylene tetrahydromethanopterin reductase [Actinotalea ferrariae CF5-4]|uniref:5,10-methylene tetrahydromethanopterin reductase n=1 Tax=Actinotalea ferrariae CF5-4 TaxID=948458 RepID=A0A021VTW5_9CELL|nr:LLM class flavin-dependent oxidoreductase [Actinotalea ferrariae]EYR63480.1 5,10-methylene tetrahydromethanopterin reductase [Actinotalea ferrariae CF5-4]
MNDHGTRPRDYGHDLLFGSFVTPTAQDPDAVVRLAVASEEAGLDLVTFQDHPYQAGFLDTWTLLTWVAARTERIHLAGNVLNLPLRQPAVLARSAASLDLLSGGRVALGLGAGGFWDAIEAMGGTRLTPGESVDALQEALEIVRGIWATGERAALRVEGTHHRVRGAKRGPAPAHDIPIWVGAYKPRMLRLVGSRADGWLPSLPYLRSFEDLDRGNAVIDAAATAAGRDPGAVRRLLNITPAELDVEVLTRLALEHGVSGFIAMGDDPRPLARLGREVAPAVRDAVAAARAERARAGIVEPGPAGRTHTGNHSDDAPGGAAAPAEPLRSSGHAGVTARINDAAPSPARATEATEVTAPSAAKAVPGVTPTPDDGVRHASRSVWREDDRPTAPPPPPGTTHSPNGRAVAQHLVDVHDHLRSELTELRRVTEQVLDGALDAGSARSAINAMTLRQNAWVLGAYCATYCRTVTGHHTLEDRSILPYLRRVEPGLEPVVDRLQAEHVDIHHVLEDVDAALVRFVSDDDGAAVLREAVDLLTDVLLSHLSYEERELIEPLARFGMAPGQV